MPKNSGPIRTATSVDFRLPESIFPVLGLMEIWTNMLLPVTPPRRIECVLLVFFLYVCVCVCMCVCVCVCVCVLFCFVLFFFYVVFSVPVLSAMNIKLDVTF